MTFVTNLSLKAWRATLLLCISGLLSGCAGLPSDVNKHTEFSGLGDTDAYLTYNTAFPIASAKEAVLRGDAAVARGDLDRALFEYIRALEKEGANGETLYKIGRVHIARDDSKRAELAFLLCLKEIPDHAGALIEMGKLKMRRREYTSARELLSHAWEINPKSAQTLNALGVIQDMQKNHNQAQRNYIMAISLDGNKPIYMNNLGYSYYLMGNQERAEQMFKDTLKVDPGYKLAWRNLGLVYAKTARFKEALAAFAKIEKECQAYNDVGFVAMLSGHFDEAQYYFKEAIKRSPVYYELAARNAKHLASLRGN
ncbi:MAG: tetratricopeptide repeat protein [Candidatus Thiodiazotropha sp. (ex Dulcina madagascariensis)]|nr:tetratricopeptide repeat protein [Candidatus Thiodiazotropha sp. (ex Dulcina madagascariensis)]MCU7925068.1 tetratricopeptide repeat protein [Candidatus Thiodiazotropha sp. (ex Dulcina madagascariensis)]